VIAAIPDVVDGPLELQPELARHRRASIAQGTKETESQAEHVKEGRDFFNEDPPAGYYKPYVYPHPLREGWEVLMKSVAASAVSTGDSMKPSAASKP
jgi:hypothetical protein